MILYNTTDVDDLFTDNHWVPSVHVDNQPGLAIKAYVATASNPTARISVPPIWSATQDDVRPAPSMTLFSSRARTPWRRTSSSPT